MEAVTLIRWAVTVAAALLWATIAGHNVSLAWRGFVRKEERVPSIIPFLGGFIACVAVIAWPLESSNKWAVLLGAWVLDLGSLPYLALGLLVLYRDWHRR